MGYDTITVITRDGFWSSYSRTFRRDKIKHIGRTPGGCTSACCPRGDYIEVELDNGEIVTGREYPTWAIGSCQ